MGEATVIDSEGLALAAHLAEPSVAPAAVRRRRGLILCHGFPSDPTDPGGLARGYAELADRLADEIGCVTLTFDFRGTGRSPGNFSIGGWLKDLQAAVDRLLVDERVADVWLCGFSAGGALAICAAGEDERVRGVAAFGAPADFGDWAADPYRFVIQARAAGLIRDPAFPSDMEAWTRELQEIRPLSLIAKIPPRPVLLVHGANDDVVPMLDVRALADAAEGQVQLRILSGAGHRLRYDPRAIALLVGWLDRYVQ